MKILSDEPYEVESLEEYYTLTGNRDICRIMDYGYDNAFYDVERGNPEGMDESDFVEAVCDHAKEIEGWDFFKFDSYEEYDEEMALSMAEICEWDDRR